MTLLDTRVNIFIYQLVTDFSCRDSKVTNRGPAASVAKIAAMHQRDLLALPARLAPPLARTARRRSSAPAAGRRRRSRPATARRATIEEITVIGRYPGPAAVESVASGEHVLWIFGDLSPVPKGLDWDPRNAERVVDTRRRRHRRRCASARRRYNPIKMFRTAARRAPARAQSRRLDACRRAAAGPLRALRRAARAPPARRRRSDELAARARCAAPSRRRARRRRPHDGHRRHENDRALMQRSDAEEAETSIETEAARPCSTELEKVTREAELTASPRC